MPGTTSGVLAGYRRASPPARTSLGCASLRAPLRAACGRAGAVAAGEAGLRATSPGGACMGLRLEATVAELSFELFVELGVVAGAGISAALAAGNAAQHEDENPRTR